MCQRIQRVNENLYVTKELSLDPHSVVLTAALIGTCMRDLQAPLTVYSFHRLDSGVAGVGCLSNPLLSRAVGISSAYCSDTSNGSTCE